jgi:hypothetical protein
MNGNATWDANDVLLGWDPLEWEPWGWELHGDLIFILIRLWIVDLHFACCDGDCSESMWNGGDGTGGWVNHGFLAGLIGLALITCHLLDIRIRCGPSNTRRGLPGG